MSRGDYVSGGKRNLGLLARGATVDLQIFFEEMNHVFKSCRILWLSIGKCFVSLKHDVSSRLLV